MKLLKRIVIALVLVVIWAAAYNYPKLTIISGYASKNMASSVFVAKRTTSSVTKNDNNAPLVKLAETVIIENGATASVFGLMERRSICRDGLGCVLVNGEYALASAAPKPKRSKLSGLAPFFLGNDSIAETSFEKVDFALLEKAVDGAFANNEVQKTRTVLIAYKNRLLTERYIEDFGPETPILGWSMAKSVLATLYGILEHQGKIDMDYRPFEKLDLTGKIDKDPRNIISLDDLLRMSSGLAWDDDYTAISDATKMLFLDADMTLAQLYTDFDLNDHREVWNYSSGTSNLLSGILRKQFLTHQEYLDFPYTALIDKIGMYSMLIETDMAGNFVFSSYAWANTRDWAKFGLLYLNRGHWKGEQLFDPSWVDYVTQPTPFSDGAFGAHFWLNVNGKFPDAPRDLYSANGHEGQYVFIIPSKELVIVRTGLAKDPDFDANNFLKNVIAAIR